MRSSAGGETTFLNALAETLRENGEYVVTSVLADDYLFTGTVAGNIRLADPTATDQDVTDLLAELLLDGAGLEPGTPSAYAGATSPGVMPAVCTSPAPLATRPDVLLIDEPTAGLDDTTATCVLAAIRARLPNAVLVLAMHGPAGTQTSSGAGRVIVSFD